MLLLSAEPGAVREIRDVAAARKRPRQRPEAQAMSIWAVGIVFELAALWFVEMAARAPDLPWHD